MLLKIDKIYVIFLVNIKDINFFFFNCTIFRTSIYNRNRTEIAHFPVRIELFKAQKL